MTEATAILADSIISPLGDSTDSTYRRVKEGKSALKYYPPEPGMPEGCMASIIDDALIEEKCVQKGIGQEYTRFEKRIILTAADAASKAGIDPSSNKVVFIISTTKANIDLLDGQSSRFSEQRIYPGEAAKAICDYFENKNTPIVVSNACISGLCAIIEGHRTLIGGKYDYAIVAGSDIQSRFIVTGFQSFKALSEEECRPFDKDRKGLNAGEASAAVVLGRVKLPSDHWIVGGSAIRNDANHISGPSRIGEGSYRALTAALGDFPASELAFINVHGTSTPYNDEMESIALHRAGLDNIPVNALKGTFGHTMGAAGILEAILSMRAADDHTILGTRGYSECGVTYPLSINNSARQTDKKAFLKLLSGFGGCNAAILFTKGGQHDE